MNNENRPAPSVKKTIFIIILFIVCAGLMAYAFSAFFIPQEMARYQDCVLLQNAETKAVDCFGCYNNICKDAPRDWQPYEPPQFGIPYGCFKSDQGCQLAQ